MARRSDLLERALAAEEECDRLRERVQDLTSRLRASINADPTTASRALSWIHRAEAAEELVEEVLRAWLDPHQRSSRGQSFERRASHEVLPAGWVSRAQAQMQAVEILRRDQAEMAERPGEEDWTTFNDDDGTRRVIREIVEAENGP